MLSVTLFIFIFTYIQMDIFQSDSSLRWSDLVLQNLAECKRLLLPCSTPFIRLCRHLLFPIPQPEVKKLCAWLLVVYIKLPSAPVCSPLLYRIHMCFDRNFQLPLRLHQGDVYVYVCAYADTNTNVWLFIWLFDGVKKTFAGIAVPYECESVAFSAILD